MAWMESYRYGDDVESQRYIREMLFSKVDGMHRENWIGDEMGSKLH